MLRRTKIVTTLGPATDSEPVLRALIQAGADTVRLNFSHGNPEDHRNRACLVRKLAAECKRSVAILGDLQGPKIRIARFKDGPIELAEGDCFALDASLGRDDGDITQVGIDYPELPNDCKADDLLLLDDGRVVLRVERIAGTRLECIVVNGGPLSNNKGINRQGGGLSAPALTEKDRADIKLAAEIGVDYVAVSFPRSGEDMNQARQLLTAAGSKAHLVAKIERAEAVADAETLDGIILASDAVMVARGDLGVEIGDAALVGVQKRIISRSRQLNRAVITATQMMESMINSPLPTRAEVMDVANAVLDGTDAVMCSAETAAGKYPVKTVEAMARVILGAERERSIQRSAHRIHQEFSHAGESIAMAAMYTANHLKNVRAIVCLTESGNTPLLMSRISSGLPIFACSNRADTLSRVALYRGVYSLWYDDDNGQHTTGESVVELLKSQGIVARGDFVLVSQGDQAHVQGGTNTLKILAVS
ncbi:pyruvate kinase [Sessilibacter sp. MAH1]